MVCVALRGQRMPAMAWIKNAGRMPAVQAADTSPAQEKNVNPAIRQHRTSRPHRPGGSFCAETAPQMRGIAPLFLCFYSCSAQNLSRFRRRSFCGYCPKVMRTFSDMRGKSPRPNGTFRTKQNAPLAVHTSGAGHRWQTQFVIGPNAGRMPAVEDPQGFRTG